MKQDVIQDQFSNSSPIKGLDEEFVPSSHDNPLAIINIVMHYIKRPLPTYAFEIDPKGFKCIGHHEDSSISCVALTKNESKVAVAFINKIIQDERYSVVVKDLLKKNFNAIFTSKEHIERKEKVLIDETFLHKKRERDVPQEVIQKPIMQKQNTIELSLLKWERYHLIDETTLVNLNSFKNTINLMMVKFKLNNPKVTSYQQVGSQLSSTLRNDYIHIDFIFSIGQISDVSFNEFIDCVYNDVNKNGCSIESCKDEMVIEIASKTFRCSIRFLAPNQANVFVNHASYLSKLTLKTEDIILIKALKVWRRAKALLFLPAEVIEYLILTQREEQEDYNSQALVERMTMFFRTLIELEEIQKEWNHLLPLVTVLLSDEINIKTLIDAGTKAINSINNNKFDELI